MQIDLICMHCPPENREHLVRLAVRDDGRYVSTCPNGHVQTTVHQEFKFEILFEYGIHALIDGYHREAVSSFASSLERFYEFSLSLMLGAYRFGNNDSLAFFKETWKSVSAQSERQLGAFIFQFATTFRKQPSILPSNAIALRNKVAHQGKIPERHEAIDFGEAVLGVIRPNLAMLEEQFSNDIRNAIHVHTAGVSAGENTTLMTLGTLLHVRHQSTRERTIEEHIQAIQHERRQIAHIYAK